MGVLSKLKCLVPPAIKLFVRRYYLLFQEQQQIRYVRLKRKVFYLRDYEFDGGKCYSKKRLQLVAEAEEKGRHLDFQGRQHTQDICRK